MNKKLHKKFIVFAILLLGGIAMNAQTYEGLPFSGTAVQIGAAVNTGYKVEMEDFDKTAANVDGVNVTHTTTGTPPLTGTYYDKSAGNSGPVRTTGDVDTSAAGTGNVVSGGQGQEYTLYTIQIMETGDYTINFNYKHSAGGGKSHQLFLRNSSDLTTVSTLYNASLPAANYANTTIVASVNITAGTYVLQSRIVQNGPSYDYVEFIRDYVAPSSGGAYNGPHTVNNAAPLLVEAEDFDIGNNANGGVAPFGYFDDQTADNDPLVYRASQRKIVNDGGVIALNDCRPGEYTYYTLTIPAGHGGTYSASVKYKSGGAGKTMQMHLMSNDLIEGALMYDETGGVTSGYEDLTGDETFTLAEGTQLVRLKANDAAPSIDSFTIATPAIIGVDGVTVEDNSLNAYPNPSADGQFTLNSATSWSVYSALGVKVLEGEGNQVDLSSLVKGMYILKTDDGISQTLLYN